MRQPRFFARVVNWLLIEYPGAATFLGAVLATLLFVLTGKLLNNPSIAWTVIVALPVAALLGILVVVGFQAVVYLCTDRQVRRERLRRFERLRNEPVTWLVELQGQPRARLSDPGWVEMFWTSYRIEPLVTDSAIQEQILNNPEWWLENHLQFRHEQLESIAPFALVAGGVFSDPGRVAMRGLDDGHPVPTMCESLLLWLRRRGLKK